MRATRGAKRLTTMPAIKSNVLDRTKIFHCGTSGAFAHWHNGEGRSNAQGANLLVLLPPLRTKRHLSQHDRMFKLAAGRTKDSVLPNCGMSKSTGGHHGGWCTMI